MNHYVYKVTYGHDYYIGVRSSKCEPEQDTYIGSGMFFYGSRGNPIKEILSTHETREDAEKEESRLLVFHIGLAFCRNIKPTRRAKYGFTQPDCLIEIKRNISILESQLRAENERMRMRYRDAATAMNNLAHFMGYGRDDPQSMARDIIAMLKKQSEATH